MQVFYLKFKRVCLIGGLLFLALVTSYKLQVTSTYAAEDINQQILDLRKQVEELEKKADEYRRVVSNKQKESQTLEREISIINNQIYRLETQVKITENQITSTQLTITDLRNKIFDRQELIGSKKEVVAQILNLMNKSDHENLLNVVLKNDHLSDFIDQVKQADNLNKSLLAAITVLKTEKENLEENKLELESEKKELENLNDTQKNKQMALAGTKEGKGDLLTKTKGQEGEYQKMLAEVERKEAEFFSALKNLEAQALQTGAFIVHVTADKVPPKGIKIFQWPEDDYRITQGYGYTAYARRGAYGGAPHNGVDIAGGFGTAIRPTANGAILASGFNNGFGNWVSVLHSDNMVSLYAHIQAPSGLSNGAAVTTESIIGYEGSTGNSTGSHLHLSVYRDFFTYINEKNGQLYFNYFDGSLNPLDYL